MRCPNRLAGTTAVCGSRTGEGSESSPSTWTATATSSEKARTGSAGNELAAGRTHVITGAELIRVEPDRSRVRHADFSHISPLGWSEITVDGRGNVYVNAINFEFDEFNEMLTSGEAPGKIALVIRDGDAREVVEPVGGEGVLSAAEVRGLAANARAKPPFAALCGRR